MKILTTRNKIIKEFALELANIQMKADKWFYIMNDQEMSSYMINKVEVIKDMTVRLGICGQVYNEAYKIYDFRESGTKNFKPNLEFLRNI